MKRRITSLCSQWKVWVSILLLLAISRLVWMNRALDSETRKELFQQFIPLVVIAILISLAFEAVSKKAWAKFGVWIVIASFPIWGLVANWYVSKSEKNVEYPLVLISDSKTGGFFDNLVFEEYIDSTSRGFSTLENLVARGGAKTPEAKRAYHAQIVLYSLLNEIAALHSPLSGGRLRVDESISSPLTRPLMSERLPVTDFSVVYSTDIFNEIKTDFFETATPIKWRYLLLPKGMSVSAQSLLDGTSRIIFTHALVSLEITISSAIQDFPSEYSWRNDLNEKHEKMRRKLFSNPRGATASLETYRIKYHASFSPWFIGNPKMSEIKAWEQYIRENLRYVFDFNHVVQRLQENGVIAESDMLYSKNH